jgi:hypothetical protein
LLQSLDQQQIYLALRVVSTQRNRSGLGLSADAIASAHGDSDRFFMIAAIAGSAGFRAFVSKHSAGVDLFWPVSQDSLS